MTNRAKVARIPAHDNAHSGNATGISLFKMDVSPYYNARNIFDVDVGNAAFVDGKIRNDGSPSQAQLFFETNAWISRRLTSILDVMKRRKTFVIRSTVLSLP